MKKLLAVFVTVMAVAAFSGMGFAAEGAAKAEPAKKMANAPKTSTGEVVKLTAGKSLEIKDEAGKTHTFNLSKKTKLEGDVKVGSKVTVTSVGRSAKEVTVAAVAAPAAPAAAAPAAPAASAAPAAPKK
jgi:hypothetical protein